MDGANWFDLMVGRDSLKLSKEFLQNIYKESF